LITTTVKTRNELNVLLFLMVSK